jgi:tripartite-type tricarboxylate transporter receptor subunit TctC
MVMRRLLGVAMLASALSGLQATTAIADAFPANRVTIVVPFPPGGGTDIIARGLANELGNLWKQPVVIENDGGANSIIGATRVARAKPDGYMLLLTVDSTIVHNRFLFKNLAYDPDKGLLPITMLARSGQLVIATKSLQANNLKELVDLGHNTPGGITYGSTGPGTQPNLMFETMASHEGIKFLQVPYKGINPIVTAVMTGEVQISTASPLSAGAMLDAGQIKAIAIGGTKRLAKYPNIPTIAESGYAYLDSTTWWGLFAPAGMSPELLAKINHDVVTVAQQPDFTEKYFSKLGVEPALDTPAEFAAEIRSNVKTIGEMVKAAGVKPIE